MEPPVTTSVAPVPAAQAGEEPSVSTVSPCPWGAGLHPTGLVLPVGLHNPVTAKRILRMVMEGTSLQTAASGFISGGKRFKEKKIQKIGGPVVAQLLWSPRCVGVTHRALGQPLGGVPGAWIQLPQQPLLELSLS